MAKDFSYQEEIVFVVVINIYWIYIIGFFISLELRK